MLEILILTPFLHVTKCVWGAYEADKNKVVAMRQAGASLMEIVAEVRFSKRTVLCWLSEARQKGTLRA